MRVSISVLLVGLIGLTVVSCGPSALADPPPRAKPAIAPDRGTPASAGASSAAEAPPEVAAVSAVLVRNGVQNISLGRASSQGNLTIFPLNTSKPTKDNPFRPLDKAMDRRQLRVSELGSASVPTLKVKNTGKEKVFVMTGEIVTGANQDRMSSHDVLLPPDKRAVRLPVYCVEQGRWAQNSQHFSAGKTAGTTMLRKTAARKGSQGKIWSKVAKKSGAVAVNSSTGTMQAVYNNRQVKKRIAKYEKKLLPLATGHQEMVGFVAAIDGEVVSADLFANHGLLRALWPKLLKAIAIDAIASKTPSARAPSPDLVRDFLRTGMNGKTKQIDNPGLGQELLIEADNEISGTMLRYDSQIIHLAVFGPDREDRPRALAPPIRSARTSRRSAASDAPAPAASAQKNDWPAPSKEQRKMKRRAEKKARKQAREPAAEQARKPAKKRTNRAIKGIQGQAGRKGKGAY